MKTIVQLVDSISYIEANCFQHQLRKSLWEACDLVQIEISDILIGRHRPPADGFISCLKQRTLMKHAQSVGSWLDGRPIVAYDQDPWQSYMDDSPYKGAYDHIVKHINVSAFALSTKWWVDFVSSRGLPAVFTRMWVLPEYCVQTTPYVNRIDLAGFVGSVHPRRKMLLDIIESGGIKTSVLATSSLGYAEFLTELSKLKCFVHNEDMTIIVDGKELNFNTGMWVKDIEAASQGCFSIRGKGDGSNTYFEGLQTVMLYDHIDQVPDVIRSIEAMDPNVRQAMIDHSVNVIRTNDVWSHTALDLVNLSLG